MFLKHQIIVVGCGSMANTWIDYVLQRDSAEIVAFVDVHLETAASMAASKQLQVPVYSDLGEALAAHQHVNLVFDVTIPAAHKQIVSTALQANCHVFGEKPMAESMKDARELLDISRNIGFTYTVMQNRRYNKQIRALRSILANNEIGHINSIHADFFLGPHFGGFREAMDSPLILDMAIHTFDQARYVTNADPVSVYCHEYNPSSSWYKGNASASCIFEMSNGVVFTYQGSWSAEGLNTSWESDWRVIGSKGTAKWDGFHLPYYEVVDETKPTDFFRPVIRKEAEDTYSGHEGHWGCLDEMFSALEQNRKAETDCEDNIKSMAMVFAAIESARTGKKVFIEAIC
ncbi:Gfo/Idh/MocA family protein [Metabacillus halosaccharovorans]|uniref:Gfo/Idh/MocA family oxidoreductase n=1 Tax=Metabacillus halosaccharovorans TaxID=930124 RepID=A0ABT3DJE7_9BACI|nr:Gfo/Idh/MocA family oxidoreductase [Metabacillus halosaccharovorans]MCV9887156.1 Gfo/Idh/MocA family oxidoreductase [Metabacillus halosaccharovorans]